MFKKYQLINIARTQLGMDDDSYRAMVIRINGGKGTSLKDCSMAELNLILKELKEKGFKVQTNSTKGLSRPHHSIPALNKALSLWITLHRAGVVKDGSDKAFNSFCKKNADSKFDHWHWMDEQDAHTIIERLKRWADREGVNI